MREERKRTVANIQYGGAYRPELERALKTGECFFCDDQKKPDVILNIFGGWFVKTLPVEWRAKSLWPKKDPVAKEVPAAQQLLIIPKRHVTDISNLGPVDWVDLGELFAWVNRTYILPGGAIGMRFGSKEHSGRTVMHLHAQVIVPPEDPDNPGVVLPVPFWVG